MNAPKTKLSGLQKICRAHGRMKCGDTMMAWDYANECAVPASEMKPGSERWKESERAKWMPEVPDVRSMTDEELSALPVLSLPNVVMSHAVAWRGACAARSVTSNRIGSIYLLGSFFHLPPVCI